MAKKVLVVDDDPTIRTLVSAILQKEGYEVLKAEDGKAALTVLDREKKSTQFEFIILDVIMPGMSGLDVLNQIKSDPSIQNIPVIMLTGEGKNEDIIAGYNTGSDYYITKPFTRQQLLKGIELVTGEEL